MYALVSNPYNVQDFGLIIGSSTGGFLKMFRNHFNYGLQYVLRERETKVKKVPGILILGEGVEEVISIEITELVDLASRHKSSGRLAEKPAFGLEFLFHYLTSDPQADGVTTVLLEAEGRYIVFFSENYQTWRVGDEVTVKVL